MEGTYIVLAHYSERRRGSFVLGHFQTYEEALQCEKEMRDYKNVLGKSVISGGAVYFVPEKPYSKDDFKFAGVGAEAMRKHFKLPQTNISQENQRGDKRR